MEWLVAIGLGIMLLAVLTNVIGKPRFTKTYHSGQAYERKKTHGE